MTNSDPQSSADAPVSDESLRSGSLAEVLKISADFAPDDLAPPVDHQKLRRFLQKGLSAEETQEVIGLVTSFRVWHSAFAELLREQDDDPSADETRRN